MEDPPPRRRPLTLVRPPGSRVELHCLDRGSNAFALQEVLDQVTALVARPAGRKGLEFLLSTAPGVPARLAGDPLRLGQVLLNLCSNAVKFTEQGEIVVVTVKAGSSRDGRVTLSFTVRDTGIGMDAEQMGRLFQPFNQLDASIARKYGGTGLDLWRSAAKSWTRRRRRRGRAPRPRAGRLEDARRRRLRAGTPDPRVVAAGHSSQPAMDGVEATRRIRARPSHAALPVVGMTAHALARDRAQCLEAGMNEVIVKPFEPNELFAATRRPSSTWRTPRSPRRAPSARTGAASPASRLNARIRPRARPRLPAPIAGSSRLLPSGRTARCRWRP